MKLVCNNYISHWVKFLSVFFVLTGIAGCSSDDLDVQEDFPFEIKVMPVPKYISVGETVEIRFSILTKGNLVDKQYSIRYFQYDGTGTLSYNNQKPYLPNDLYPLASKEFRLYYTSQSFSSDQFEVWIADSFGNEKQISFQFNKKTSTPIFIGPIR